MDPFLFSFPLCDVQGVPVELMRIRTRAAIATTVAGASMSLVSDILYCHLIPRYDRTEGLADYLVCAIYPILRFYGGRPSFFEGTTDPSTIVLNIWSYSNCRLNGNMVQV
jgi:hypothetical protein